MIDDAVYKFFETMLPGCMINDNESWMVRSTDSSGEGKDAPVISDSVVVSVIGFIGSLNGVTDLRPKEEKQSKQKSFCDACYVPVLDDKPAIIEQISSGLNGANWKVSGGRTTGVALDYRQIKKPDAIMISLSLPEEAAFTLFRILRSNMKTKYIPIFGLAVKSESHLQQQATHNGFSAIITKPIDFEDLDNKLSKAINLDTLAKYFRREDGFFIINIPANLSQNVQNEIAGYMKKQVSSAVDEGLNKVIFDGTKMSKLDNAALKLMIMIVELCKDLGLNLTMAGNATLIEDFQNDAESKDWVIFGSIEEAKASPVSA